MLKLSRALTDNHACASVQATGSSRSPANLPTRLSLVKDSQEITDQQDKQDGAKADACASACAPPAVAVVSAAAAENQHQYDNQNDQEHFISPLHRVATPW